MNIGEIKKEWYVEPLELPEGMPEPIQVPVPAEVPNVEVPDDSG